MALVHERLRTAFEEIRSGARFVRARVRRMYMAEQTVRSPQRDASNRQLRAPNFEPMQPSFPTGSSYRFFGLFHVFPVICRI